MDPVTLATVTAALTLVGTEATKGVASQAGKDIWGRAKQLLGWSKEPSQEEMPKAIASQLNGNDVLLNEVVALLQGAQSSEPSVQMIGSLVGTLIAEKAVVANRIEGGTIKF